MRSLLGMRLHATNKPLFLMHISYTLPCVHAFYEKLDNNETNHCKSSFGNKTVTVNTYKSGFRITCI